jgi:hypothetical protein
MAGSKKATDQKSLKPGPTAKTVRTAKVNLESTDPADIVPFRPTLDPLSVKIIQQLGHRWQLRGNPTALKIVEPFLGKEIDKLPLAKFIRDVWPNIEPHSIKSTGVLYMWTKYTHDEIKRLAWDANLGGNMSKMMRVMIYYTAIKEGIPVPKT